MNVVLQPPTSLTRIAPHAGLWGNVQACLSQRFTTVSCSACIDGCPTRALSITHDGFELDHGCVDCGRCVAACPTGALAMAGLAVAPPAESGGPIVVECTKVPAAACPPDALRVPCTGALSTSRLLALVNASAGNGVEVVDRGWCAHCRAGGDGAHPAEERMAEANALLDAVGAGRDARISFRGRFLPVSSASHPSRPAGGEPAIGRRAFLHRLVGQAARAVPVAHDASQTLGKPSPPDGRARIVPTERLSLLRELGALAARSGRGLPGALFPALQLTSDCDACGVCAPACPVAALRVVHSTEFAALAFDPRLCIGCGACARLCPQQAIDLAASDGAPHLDGPRTLREWPHARCFDCGSAFVPTGPAAAITPARCPSCRKSDALTRSLFSERFAPHHDKTMIDRGGD